MPNFRAEYCITSLTQLLYQPPLQEDAPCTALGLIALAVDRRALLVSALACVLAALTYLFREFGVVELNVALTAFVIGYLLLLLSAFWHHARAAVVGLLPEDVSRRLPDNGRAIATA